MHSVKSLEAELQRVGNRPGFDSAPPVLCEFTVDVDGDTGEYVRRLRSVLAVAVRLGGTADFDADDLPADGVPDWFAAISPEPSAAPEQAPEFARRGREAFVRDMESRPWALQDWLFRFDPEDDSRGWEWWDATQPGDSKVRLWVDSWGESFFGCQELRWLAYTAGALHVDGPAVQRTGAWAAEAGGEDVDD
ncbi:hypothetical protein [Streptomyces beijiangensis]|nr:hypothetical protein [Streptomyces beijiangensis]